MMTKNRPTIIFRADGGGITGFGHVVRSAALAGYLRDEFDCKFVSRSDSAAARDFIARTIAAAGARYLEIPDSPGMSQEDFNESFLSIIGPEALTVLDNYFYDTGYQEKIRDKSRALVSIDDMPDRKFVSDILFTPSPLSAEDFRLAPHTRFYGGIEWTFLREPFLRPAPERDESEIRRVVIAMGGADPLGITRKILPSVRKLLPDARMDVISGPSARTDVSGFENVFTHKALDAAGMADLFDNSDYGIFAASTVSIEAMARNLPVASGWYADNQYNYYKGAVGEGLFAGLGDLRDPAGSIETRLAAGLEARTKKTCRRFDFAERKKEIISIFKELWKQTEKNA